MSFDILMKRWRDLQHIIFIGERRCMAALRASALAGRRGATMAPIWVGADVDAKAGDDEMLPNPFKHLGGWVAVHGAVASGSMDVVGVVVGTGASVDEKGSSGIVALYCGAALNRVGALQMLLMAGANAAERVLGGWRALDRGAYGGHVGV